MRTRNVAGALILAVFLLAMINPLSEQAAELIGSSYSLFASSSNWIDVVLISIVVFFLGLAMLGLWEKLKYY